jgi:acetyl esterase/lipase
VYLPPNDTINDDEEKPPILVFFYGGGFINGGRLLPDTSLVYANIGAFFAARGCITVIPDYCLLPAAKYPSGTEDVAASLSWILENLKEGDTSRLYILAHSAGGVHVAGMLLQPSVFTSSLRDAVRGIILLGTPFEMQNDKETALQYYGSAKNIATDQPLSLLRRAPSEYIASLPPLRNLLAESEPRRISASARNFAKLYESKGGTIENYVLEGHSHLSPVMSLSSGNGEKWAELVCSWLQH